MVGKSHRLRTHARPTVARTTGARRRSWDLVPSCRTVRPHPPRSLAATNGFSFACPRSLLGCFHSRSCVLPWAAVSSGTKPFLPSGRDTSLVEPSWNAIGHLPLFPPVPRSLPGAFLHMESLVHSISFESDDRRSGSPLRVAGLEPAIPAWKAGVLPLHHTRSTVCATARPRSEIPSLYGGRFSQNPMRIDSAPLWPCPGLPRPCSSRAPPGPRAQRRANPWPVAFHHVRPEHYGIHRLPHSPQPPVQETGHGPAHLHRPFLQPRVLVRPPEQRPCVRRPRCLLVGFLCHRLAVLYRPATVLTRVPAPACPAHPPGAPPPCPPPSPASSLSDRPPAPCLPS